MWDFDRQAVQYVSSAQDLRYEAARHRCIVGIAMQNGSEHLPVIIVIMYAGEILHKQAQSNKQTEKYMYMLLFMLNNRLKLEA